MKIALLTIIFTLSSYAGIGGIVGGTDKFQRGNTINFQRASTFVNILHNKSLCHDGYDYEAVVKKCTLWVNDDGERKCAQRERTKIFQPLESDRLRCARFEEDECVEYERVPLKQSPKRILEIKDRDGSIKKLKKHVIPNCR
ncbi:MAG: hypothetical protein VXV96_06240 [Bdellovibrionota bacterium]|nr:hypothetical protein [Bdellovibrionota bacterium]